MWCYDVVVKFSKQCWNGTFPRPQMERGVAFFLKEHEEPAMARPHINYVRTAIVVKNIDAQCPRCCECKNNVVRDYWRGNSRQRNAFTWRAVFSVPSFELVVRSRRRAWRGNDVARIKWHIQDQIENLRYCCLGFSCRSNILVHYVFFEMLLVKLRAGRFICYKR